MITTEKLYTKPPDLGGGILADPMGLGKSLTVLSLIAKDLEIGFKHEDGFKAFSGTLLIVPPARRFM